MKEALLPSDDYIRCALRSRSLTDWEFDCLYPSEIRLASHRYWTPLGVAWRTAEILIGLGVRRVLDVGSGAGKFCVAAGASAPNIEFVGVEQRTRLVTTAREVARDLAVSNVEFLIGDATLKAFEGFDAFYLFNPFAENIFEPGEHLDRDVDLSFERYVNDRRRMRSALTLARVGTVVVTYHGFGAPPPAGYAQLRADPLGSDVLCVWQKRQDRAPSRHRSGECFTTVACNSPERADQDGHSEDA